MDPRNPYEPPTADISRPGTRARRFVKKAGLGLIAYSALLFGGGFYVLVILAIAADGNVEAPWVFRPTSLVKIPLLLVTGGFGVVLGWNLFRLRRWAFRAWPVVLGLLLVNALANAVSGFWLYPRGDQLAGTAAELFILGVLALVVVRPGCRAVFEGDAGA